MQETETKRRKSHIQDSSHRRMYNKSDSYLPFSSTVSIYSRLHHRDSPFCSHSSSNTEFYSEVASEFPSSRNQSFGTSCNDNNNCSSCFCEIDEWLENATKFFRPSNFHIRYSYPISESGGGGSMDQNGRSPEEDKLSMSSICKTFLQAPQHELYSITLPSDKEESTVYEGQSRLACKNSIYGASKSEKDHGRGKPLSRPKPYNAFLNEVEMQKLQAERESWKRAKQVKLMERLRRKEAAIDDWEMEQTRIAMEKMKKLQNKLEMKQLKISLKIQKEICLVKQKAEKQKRNLRRATIEKIAAASNISETHRCRGFMCLKLG